MVKAFFSAEPNQPLHERQPARKAPIEIVVADDHPIVRSGIVANLMQQRDMKVVAEGNDGLEALALVKKYLPDVVLLDLRMPRMDGLEVVAKINALHIQKCEQQKSLKVVLEAIVQTGKQNERFFKEGIGHALDDVFFQPCRIIQHEIDKIRDEQQRRQPFEKLQGEWQQIFPGEPFSELLEVLVNLSTQVHAFENWGVFFKRLGGFLDQILSTINIPVKIAMPRPGLSHHKQRDEQDDRHRNQLKYL